MLRIEACDVFDSKYSMHEVSEQQIDSYDYVNSLYNKIFSFYSHKRPSLDISEKDFGIVRAFTNEKSFEKAVEVCFQLLKSQFKTEEKPTDENDYDNVEDDKSCVSNDSVVLVSCLNHLIDCRIPHSLKPGFLIILVRYCFYEGT